MSHTGTTRSRQHDVSTMVWGNLPRAFARLPVLCFVFSDKERDNLTQCDVRRRCHHWRTALRPSILNQVGWFWAVPIRISNRQQKHKPLSGMFCRLHFVRTIFFENRIRNRLYQCCFVLWYWGIVTVSLRTSQGSMHKRLRIVDVLPHPVTFEMYDHLWPKCDQMCFARKTNKNSEHVTNVTDSKLWHFVTVKNVTNGHTLSVTGTNPVSGSVWNPDQNDSHFTYQNGRLEMFCTS